MRATRFIYAAAALLLLGGVAACGGGGAGGSALPVATATPTAAPAASPAATAATASASAALVAGYNPIAAAAGFSGYLTMPSPAPQATWTQTVGNVPPAGVPALQSSRVHVLDAAGGIALLYETWSFSTSPNAFNIEHGITIPASMRVAGAGYYLASYNGASGWQKTFLGPVLIDGTGTVRFFFSQLNFTSPPQTFALYAGASPTPSPSPTPVPTMSPSPSPVPTPSSTPVPTFPPQSGPVFTFPQSLAFGAAAASANDATYDQTFSVSESGYAGPFTHTDTCLQSATVATVSPQSGTAFTVRPLGSGICSITVYDAQNRSAVVGITVNVTNITVNGVIRRGP